MKIVQDAKDAGYLCGDCADAAGGVWPKGHMATWSEGSAACVMNRRCGPLGTIGPGPSRHSTKKHHSPGNFRSMTRTYAYMPVSAQTYDEIKLALIKAGYDHTVIEAANGNLLDLCGICLTKQTGPSSARSRRRPPNHSRPRAS